MPTKVEISTKTLFTVFGILGGIYLLYVLQTLVIELLVATILMVAINPTVTRIQNLKIGSYKPNRPTAALVAYLFYFLIVSFIITIVARPLASETSILISQLPEIAEQINQFYPLDGQGVSQLLNQIGSFSNNILGILTGVFTNVIAVFATIVISFYLVLERPRLPESIAHLIGNDRHADKINKVIMEIEHELGGWVRAQLLLMVIVGSLSYIGFIILQLPHALPLAIVAGFMELIPNIGPTISTIPAALSGLSVSIWHGVGAICWCFIVQWLENNLIVPTVMSRSAGVQPLITIISLIIGFTIAGVPGAVLAVPGVIVVRNLLENFVYKKIQESNT